MDEDSDCNSMSGSLEILPQCVPVGKDESDYREEQNILSIHKAIEDNCLSAVEEFLSVKSNLEIENEFGETPLLVAVRQRNKVIVEKLIRKGADVNAEDDSSNTPLMRAVETNFWSIVDLLLKNGASCSVENVRCQTPLLLAIRLNFEPIFDRLVEAGADVTMENSQYESPIQIALTKVNVKLAKKLLDKGALITAADAFEALSISYAGHFEILFDLVLDYLYINSTGVDNWSLLHLAVVRQNKRVVLKLIERGADVKVKCTIGNTPLHIAAKHPNMSILTLLLNHGVDVNAMNVKGQTALTLAVEMCNTDAVQVLLNAGAVIQDELNLSLTKTSSRSILGLLFNARKMQLANMKVHLLQNDRKCPKRLTNVYAFEIECLKELAKVIFGNFSLRNILEECGDHSFVYNRDLQYYLKSDIITRNFPRYADLLKRAIKDGIKRQMLIDKLSPYFQLIICSSSTHIVVPNEMSCKILSYLCYKDLLNLKVAFYLVDK